MSPFLGANKLAATIGLSMYCAECGKRNRDGSRFCAQCGAPLHARQEPSSTQRDPTRATRGAHFKESSVVHRKTSIPKGPVVLVATALVALIGLAVIGVRVFKAGENVAEGNVEHTQNGVPSIGTNSATSNQTPSSEWGEDRPANTFTLLPDETDRQSIVEFLGNRSVTEEPISFVCPCREEILHAPLESGLIQIGNVILRIRDLGEGERANGRASLSFDFETARYAQEILPTIADVCSLLGKDLYSQLGVPKDLSSEDGSTALLYYDDNFIIIGRGIPMREDGTYDKTFGNSLAIDIRTDCLLHDVTVWYPGGINNSGYLSDGTKCTLHEAELYLETYGYDMRYHSDYAYPRYTVDCSDVKVDYYFETHQDDDTLWTIGRMQ